MDFTAPEPLRRLEQEVPRRVVQFWHDGKLPRDVEPLVDTWRRIPGYSHALFDDAMAELFLHDHFGSDYVDAFRDLRFPAARSDLFRLAYLARLGGIYVDAGIRSLDARLDWLPTRTGLVFIRKWHGSIINGFLAAQQSSPLLAEMVQRVLENITAKVSNNIWLVTGAGVVNAVLSQSDVNYDVLDWPTFRAHCYVDNKLVHKQHHWSKLQVQQPIFYSSEQ